MTTTMSLTRALATPRILSHAVRATRYPYSPEFLSHFDRLLIRAAHRTLLIPDHPGGYVLDTRWGTHAMSEVLLRRHKDSITHVLAAGRFPHRVERLKPLLTMPTLDVRHTPLRPAKDRPRCYLLDHPHSPVHDWPLPHPDSAHHGYYLAPTQLHAPALASWLPHIAGMGHGLIVLELAPRGEEAALLALQALRLVWGTGILPTPPEATGVKEMTLGNRLPGDGVWRMGRSHGDDDPHGR
jgi:hypothetical protein